ncbi:MAG: hypothetical protein IPH37_19165 [Burkholderiales bacterium]|nr:hypothetical protein [Burkholderiales bacterium]
MLSAGCGAAFSGEGQALHALVLAGVAILRLPCTAQLHWQDVLQTDVLARAKSAGLSPQSNRRCGRMFETSRFGGVRPGAPHHFLRRCRSTPGLLEDLNPRLADARALLQTGAVQAGRHIPLEATVQSADMRLPRA